MASSTTTIFLVTGANRGIGLEMARLALRRGDAVVATVRPGVSLDDLHTAVPDGGSLRVLTMDVADEASVDTAAAQLDEPVDVLVCNAAYLPTYGGVDDPAHRSEGWQTALMTNVAGVFFTLRAFLPHLRRSASPRVAVLSSGMGSSKRVLGGAYAYRATKAAVNNLVINLAHDLRSEGIAVGSYSPGWVRTQMGGDEAPLDAEESARGLLSRFEVLSLATSSVLEDHLGQPLEP